MSRRAGVFLDRDGTIIEDVGYLADPAEVRLLPGAAEAIIRLNRSNIPAIVVTNQSGVARGRLTMAQYQATEARLDATLEELGARLDAHYFCPHHPEITGVCECRKPGTLLYRQAADRFGLALEECWWIGDRLRDIEAGRALGGRGGMLVLTGEGRAEAASAQAAGFQVVSDLVAAVEHVLHGTTAV